MLRRFLLLPAAAILAFTAGPGLQSSSQQAPAARTSAAPVTEVQAKAKKLYQRDCAMCHGDDGAGQTGMATSMHLKIPDWSDPKALTDKSDQALFSTIRKGTATMPLESGDRASDEEVKNLIAYIRTFSKTQPESASK